ncbi:MAG: endonuclease/exonuclease/phosphatase family protein, partial [Candidatus Karelsulcia muelleri]
MMEKSLNRTTPGGIQSLIAMGDAIGPTDSGEPETTCREKTSKGNPACKLRTKKKCFMGTLNINSLLKTGKLKQLIKVMDENKIQILALQETRFTDEDVMESEGYRIFKGKKGWNPMGRGIPHLGTGFVVNNKIVNSVTEFYSPNERLSIMTLRCANKSYTFVNCHAPINEDNRRNPEKVESFWEGLEQELSKIPGKNIKILLGDFNAQIGREKKFRKIVGDYPAHKRTNRNGERLIEMCRGMNLKLMSTNFRKIPRKQKTWRSPNPALGEYQIDHVAISFRNQKEIMNVKVKKSANIETDHYLTVIKTKLIPQRKIQRGECRIQRIDTETLGLKRQEFQEKLSVDMNDWEGIKTSLVKSSLEVAPLKKHKKHRWWNESCEEALNLRMLAWKKWHASKKDKHYIEFKNQRSLTAKIIRTAKRNFERDQLLQIEEEFRKNNTRTFYKTFKQGLQGYRPPNLCFRDERGKLALNNQENCEILAGYFKKLLNSEEPLERFPKQVPSCKYENSGPPSVEEIQQIIREMKNNKAPGDDSIVAEMWKYANVETVQKLQRVIQDIWEKEELPEEWRYAIIHPIHKKGDRTDTNNYRGISLLPVTYKILSKALQSRIENQIEQQLGEYQGGFRRGRS